MAHAHLRFICQLRVRKHVSFATARQLADATRSIYAAFGKQLLLAAEGPHECLQIEKDWAAKAERPFDPYLTPQGEQQAKAVAAELKKFDLQRVYVSPFLRLAATHC